MPRHPSSLALGITLLAFAVVLLGAYTRLTGAGLGCPDWPGCYGQLSVPEGLPTARQAWTEMIHRYVAGALVVMVALQAWLSWRTYGWRQPAAVLMLGVVALQVLLGLWTVTLKVWPHVVTLHLLGGLTTLSLAYLHWRRLTAPRATPAKLPALRWLAAGAVAVLIAQVCLGGWTSTNHAGAICPALPGCGAVAWQGLDLSSGLQLQQPIGPSYLAGALPLEARAGLHMMHRLGAVALMGVLAALAVALYRQGLKGLAGALAAAGAGQALIGMATALWSAPLPLALAHTVGAAALALVLLEVNHRVYGLSPAIGRRRLRAQWQPQPALLRDAP